MNKLILMMCVAGLTACSTSRSRFDEFEKVKVDKMVGNDVNLHIFSRTIVCLNAMREAKWPQPSTNQTIWYQTNYATVCTTNLTVTTSINEQLASMTNVTAAPVLPSALAKESGSTAVEGSQPVIALASPSDTGSAGVTVSTLRSESAANAPNQSVVSRTLQTVTLVNQQGTLNTNSQSVTAGTNQVITVETNMVVTTVTNSIITAETNTVVASPSQPLFDYYLYTEVAPADFSLQPGESLVVLADGVRYGLTPTQPQSGWKSRRGYLTTFYKVPPEAISDIANAKEVKIRIKSASGALERTLNVFSRQHFRDFLVKHFGPDVQTVKEKALKDSRS